MHTIVVFLLFSTMIVVVTGAGSGMGARGLCGSGGGSSSGSSGQSGSQPSRRSPLTNTNSKCKDRNSACAYWNRSARSTEKQVAFSILTDVVFQFTSSDLAAMFLFNLREIVQVVSDDKISFLAGKDMSEIKILHDDNCALAVLIENGKFTSIGTLQEKNANGHERVDCKGGCLVPGLVDAHSHPVFAGDRVHEFALKLAGATYAEVQEKGGGIHFTTEATRAASEDKLFEDFERVAAEMLRNGTTCLEAKSGYGLNEETELKMLRVLDRAAQSNQMPLEISTTFCGAHAVPKGSTEAEQTTLIIDRLLPAIAKEKQEGRLKSVENVDIFCEKGNFGIDSTRRILKAAAEIGLRGNFHADELNPLGGAELAAELKSAAAAHLEEISTEGIRQLAAAGTVAVLLPTTAYILRLKPPPARSIIEAGGIVALGSDFNPNAPCLSMPIVMHLACVNMKLSMNEALVGRVADAVLIDAPSWEHLIYRLGSHHELIRFVVKSGKIAYRKQANS
ncbi:putative imidazolonepropionase [Aphelenchoides besseyi]|nr:putative imidazolonepropionase [Aphelenchoides besseyi]